jgi:glycosyltransferase involved in cell wall biosynthesis
MAFFSIILPTFNRAHFLPKAIESVLAQTFEDWELVIVDDGSTDNTREVVVAYKDPRIVYSYQENQERSTARNNGIEKAKGEYICFLDSDDYYLPEKLINFKNAIAQHESSRLLFYDGLIFEIENERSKTAIPIKKAGETIHEFLIQNPIGPLQVCGSSSLFNKHNFDTNLRIGEDVELWLRMANEVTLIAVDSHQTVAQEHEDRSVNLRKYNAAKEQSKQLEMSFLQYTKDQISSRIRRKVKSDCIFNIAKHHMMNQRLGMASFNIISSIITDPSNRQNKHRVFCLLVLIVGKIPQEYQVQ